MSFLRRKDTKKDNTTTKIKINALFCFFRIANFPVVRKYYICRHIRFKTTK